MTDSSNTRTSSRFQPTAQLKVLHKDSLAKYAASTGLPNSSCLTMTLFLLSTSGKTCFKHKTQPQVQFIIPPPDRWLNKSDNRGLEAYLRCFTNDHPNSWYHFFHLAELWYNTSHHSAIGTSPFTALYVRSPPSTLDFLHTPFSKTTMTELLHQHTLILHELKKHLQCTRQRMRDNADCHRFDVSFNICEWVWLRLQSYRQQSVERRTSPKLTPRYFGPYQILRRIGMMAYEFRLPTTSKIHLVFHASLLLSYKGPSPSHISNSCAISLPTENNSNSNSLSPNSLVAPTLPTKINVNSHPLSPNSLVAPLFPLNDHSPPRAPLPLNNPERSTYPLT